MGLQPNDAKRVKVTCPECGKVYRVTKRKMVQMAGEEARCENCGAKFPMVPTGDDVEDDVEAEVPHDLPKLHLFGTKAFEVVWVYLGIVAAIGGVLRMIFGDGGQEDGTIGSMVVVSAVMTVTFGMAFSELVRAAVRIAEEIPRTRISVED